MNILALPCLFLFKKVLTLITCANIDVLTFNIYWTLDMSRYSLSLVYLQFYLNIFDL